MLVGHREFFRLLWVAVSNDNSLFTGCEGARHLTHNMIALANGEYAVVGRLISMALIYGGSAPHFLSEAVTSYIFNEKMSERAIDEITDMDAKEKIELVSR